MKLAKMLDDAAPLLLIAFLVGGFFALLIVLAREDFKTRRAFAEQCLASGMMVVDGDSCLPMQP